MNFCVVLIALLFGYCHIVTSATPGEPCWEKTCEFTLSLTLGHTLTYNHPDGKVDPLVLHPGECLKTVDGTCVDLGVNKAGSHIISGDGRRRSVFRVNGQFPGPTIEVTEGATVIVHVINSLASISTTMHWHGMTMADSQWMDGPSYITQCPIPPGHTYTYRFTASPSGTHWYHPHHANLRADGHYGLLIVHKSMPSMSEIPLILSDWFYDDLLGERIPNFREGYFGSMPPPVSSLINGRGRHVSIPNAPLTKFNVEAGKKYRFRCVNAASELAYTVSIDHHMLTILAWDGSELKPIDVDSFNIFAGESVDFVVQADPSMHSSWIRAEVVGHNMHHGSGHGESMSNSRRLNESLTETHRNGDDRGPQNGKGDMHAMGPMEGGTGAAGPHSSKPIAKESISGGMEEPHSAEPGDGDHHKKEEHGSGSHNMGETKESISEADTQIKNNNKSSIHGNEDKTDVAMNHGGGNRGISTMHEVNLNALAILSYGPSSEPISHKTTCTATAKCRQFNCYKNHSKHSNIICIDLKDIQTAENSDLYKYFSSKPKRDIFMNVASNIGSSVSGLRFVPPLSPFYDPHPYGLISCRDKCHSADKACWCTNQVKLIHNDLVNIIFTNFESANHKASEGHAGHTTGHPMHIHGHRFAVVGQGFATSKPISGEIIGNNKAVICDSDLCMNPSWNISLPARNLHLNNPPLKDTINVPPGGYVIIRLQADNPGYWLMHCHMMRDQLDGMAGYFEVAPEKVKPPPSQMPSCSPGLKEYPQQHLLAELPAKGVTARLSSENIPLRRMELIGVILGSFAGGVLMVLVVLIITKTCRRNSSLTMEVGPKTPLGHDIKRYTHNTRF